MVGMAKEQLHTPPTAIPSRTAGRLLPVPRLSTLITIIIVLLLIYAFFSRLTLQFYASALFLFYSLTKSMWVSVVLLGVFQTLLMIPFRITNLIKSANIKEFKEHFAQIKQRDEQRIVLKKSVGGGRRVALYYLVNFFVYLTSYVTMGRLFLTDFYTQPLDPWLLYDFVPYPDYPILDRFFKIPYVWFNETLDLGMGWVFIVWMVGIGLQVLIYVLRSVMKSVAKRVPSEGPGSQVVGVVRRYATGYLIVFLVLSYILMRNFPWGWQVRVFSGDVAQPNRRFNTITAVVTFVTLVWINMPKIRKKTELALEAGMDEAVVRVTENEMFRETVKVSALVGLGAYFITNRIPSAFELSIFTLEMISLLSPLTLDALILSGIKQKEKLPAATHEDNGQGAPPIPSAEADTKEGEEKKSPLQIDKEVKATLPLSPEKETNILNSPPPETEEHTTGEVEPTGTSPVTSQKVTTNPITGKKTVEGEIQF